MVMPNYERVGKALLLVRDGIKPTLEQTWVGVYGDAWLEEVNQKDRTPEPTPSPDDLMFLLEGVWNTWNDVWRHQFGHAERNWVSELREARNKWAHNESFSTNDTYRVLDTSERLLASFQAADEVQQVRTLAQDLLRQRYAEEARTEQRKAATSPTKGEPTAGLAPWREVVDPHPDVREGRLEQAEFAADLYQVLEGIADEEYQDPVSFFRRTFITQGLGDLLVTAARRLSGAGGDPVVELQTNFGGGKTHSLIALYHLASGVAAKELPGVGELLSEQELTLPEAVNRSVFVGQMVSPASTHLKPDGTEVHTIWGEIAWQLGGADGYEIVKEADVAAKNPGHKLVDLFKKFGPAVVLIDEWVAYARGLPDTRSSNLPAGDFDTQFTFAQALTEAAAAVDNVLILVSIPSSDIEVGGDRGQEALIRLKNVVARKAAQWQPATADETFEIVRRRLFEPISPEKARVRDGVVKAFSDYYRANPSDFPSDTKEAEYRRRMEMAYPIHPELFDRLYSDWSTLDRFQRTRGVLRLMAAVITELWRRDDKSLLIMPGTIPVDSSSVVSELTKYLEEGWEPIIRSDVDGPNSLPLRLDQGQPNLGRYSAARRAARTVYMGSAPREEGRKGIDLKRIALGCVQPGEAPGVFGDALRRLSSEATYLYVDGAQYWYSLQPNVIRLANDRAASNYTADDADFHVRDRLLKDVPRGVFGGIHVFPDGPGDVPDESEQVRLVILPMSTPHTSNEMDGPAIQAAKAILDQRSGGPRLNRNLLVFVAADANRVEELRSAVRQHMAWKSIIEERGELNLNEHQRRQAESKLNEADQTVTQRIGETFQFVLTPKQSPGSADVAWEQTRASASEPISDRVARKLEAEEKLIPSYAGIRVRMELDRIPLWSERGDIPIRKLWSYYAQYLYMPRLSSFDVLARAIETGVSSMSWSEETFAFAEEYREDSGRYQGLVMGQHVSVGMSQAALLVRPDVALEQVDTDLATSGAPEAIDSRPGDEGPLGDGLTLIARDESYRRFYGRKAVDPVRAIRDLESLLDNIVKQLAKAESASVKITVEVEAQAAGFDDAVRRTVSENATQLGFERHEFEA